MHENKQQIPYKYHSPIQYSSYDIKLFSLTHTMHDAILLMLFTFVETYLNIFSWLHL